MDYIKKILSTLYLLFFLINIDSCQKVKNPIIIIDTPIGQIIAELYHTKAPITVNNFLSYIEQNRYDDCHFYRVVHSKNQPQNNIQIEVIQGGLGFEKHPMELIPIKHETTKKTGILHKNGTISMARLEPGTASSEFFICIKDQPELNFGGKRNPDGQGFAAFGKVIKGMNIVKNIQNLDSQDQILEKIIPINIKISN